MTGTCDQSVVKNQPFRIEFHPTGLCERIFDSLHVILKNREQSAVGDVSRSDHQQAGGATGEEMGIEEIPIFADDDRVLRICGS